MYQNVDTFPESMIFTVRKFRILFHLIMYFSLLQVLLNWYVNN